MIFSPNGSISTANFTFTDYTSILEMDKARDDEIPAKFVVIRRNDFVILGSSALKRML